MGIKSKKYRDSARGQDCTLEILGVCNYNTETTVLAHFPDETKGIGKKSDDISSGYVCSSCHDVVDDRRAWPAEEQPFKDWYLRRAQTRTIRRAIELGVLIIK